MAPPTRGLAPGSKVVAEPHKGQYHLREQVG